MASMANIWMAFNVSVSIQTKEHQQNSRTGELVLSLPIALIYFLLILSETDEGYSKTSAPNKIATLLFLSIGLLQLEN
jgi:hypothetical protein